MVLRTIFSNDAAVPRGLTRLAAKLLSGHSSVWVFVFSITRPRSLPPIFLAVPLTRFCSTLLWLFGRLGLFIDRHICEFGE